jgi:hypothetical protein
MPCPCSFFRLLITSFTAAFVELSLWIKMSTRRDDSESEHEEVQASKLRTRQVPNPNSSSGEEDSKSDATESESGKGEGESDEEQGAGDESVKLARASESDDSDSDDEANGGAGASVDENRRALRVLLLGSSDVPGTYARSQVSSVNEPQSETGVTGDRQHFSDRLAAQIARPVHGSSVATQAAGSVLPAGHEKSESSETSNIASERDRHDPGTETPRLGSGLERVGSWATDDAGASSSRK